MLFSQGENGFALGTFLLWVDSDISSPAQPAAIQRFGDKYLALLRRYGIDPRAERWYVRRAERYIESVPGRRLTEHRPANVNGYLAELANQDRGKISRLGRATASTL